MARIPKPSHEHINTAFPAHVCLVGSVLPNGFARITPRGGTMVYDDEHLALWERGKGSTSANCRSVSCAGIRGPGARRISPRTPRRSSAGRCRMDGPDGRLLLRERIEHATRREFVYRHDWHEGDLVIRDNRCTMHRGRHFDESHVRDPRRVTVRDVGSTLEGAA
jgi:hypothetical protein